MTHFKSEQEWLIPMEISSHHHNGSRCVIVIALVLVNEALVKLESFSPSGLSSILIFFYSLILFYSLFLFRVLLYYHLNYRVSEQAGHPYLLD